jgi:hypothetical protein
VFNPEYITRLQDEHERGVANHRKLLWTLLMFELWHESFVETPRRIETSVSRSGQQAQEAGAGADGRNSRASDSISYVCYRCESVAHLARLT